MYCMYWNSSNFTLLNKKRKFDAWQRARFAHCALENCFKPNVICCCFSFADALIIIFSFYILFSSFCVLFFLYRRLYWNITLCSLLIMFCLAHIWSSKEFKFELETMLVCRMLKCMSEFNEQRNVSVNWCTRIFKTVAIQLKDYGFKCMAEELSGVLVCIKGKSKMKHIFMLLSQSPSLLFGAFLVNCDVRVHCVICMCMCTYMVAYYVNFKSFQWNEDASIGCALQLRNNGHWNACVCVVHNVHSIV